MVEVFVEVIKNTNPNVFIFGQGHVGLAISKTLEDAPLNLYGIDEREEWLEKGEQFKQTMILLEDVEEIYPPKDAICVVLTHSRDLDFEIVNLYVNEMI